MYKPLLEAGDLFWIYEDYKYNITHVDADHDSYSIEYVSDNTKWGRVSIQGTDEQLLKGRWFYKKMKKINDFKKAIDEL